MTVIKKETKTEDLSDYNKIYAISYDGYVQSYLNPLKIEASAIIEDSEQYLALKQAEITELKIFQKMEITTNETHLIKLDHLYEKNKFHLQRLWNKPEDITQHKFWLAPQCQCPKSHNESIFPSKSYIISENCLIHRHRLFKIT